MATYGRGQMLGSGINPESFKQDYSGFANAAAIRAQGLSNLGASIGGAIKMVGDERKEINQNIAKGKSALQFAKANYPELADRIDEIGKIFSDVNTSKADQAAAGAQMGEFVTAMIRGQEFNKEVELKERQLGIQEAGDLADFAAKERELQAKLNQRIAKKVPFGDRDLAVTEDAFGNLYVPNTPNDPNSGRLITNIESYAVGRDDFGPKADNAITSEVIEAGLNSGVPASTSDAERLSIAAKNATPLPNPNQSYDSDVPSVLPGSGGSGDYPDGVLTTGNPIDQGVQTQPVTPPTPRGVPRNNKPLVEVNTAKSLQEERAKEVDKRLFDQREQLQGATTNKDSIKEMIRLIDQGVKTGFAQDAIMKFNRAFGKDVSDSETFKAVSGDVAMGFINLTKGAISDKEMTYFTTVLAPNLGNTPEGNKKIGEFMLKAVDKAERIEKVISDGMRKNKNAFDIDEEVRKIRNADDLLTSIDPKPNTSGIPSIGLSPEAQEARKVIRGQ
jgi:hypothetical protein